MRKDRLRYLINEYKLVEQRLDEVRAEQVRIETSLEISREVEKELTSEVKKAKQKGDSQGAKFWEDIIKDCFHKDKDKPTQQEIEKVKEMSENDKKHIVYYERKLKSIRKILGDRLSELFEGYTEKNILMGGGSSSSDSFRRIVAKEEEEKEIEAKRRRDTNVNFDKM